MQQQQSQFNDEEQEELFQIVRYTISLINNYQLISAVEAEVFLQKRAILEELYYSQASQQTQEQNNEKQLSTKNQQQLHFKKDNNISDRKSQVNQLQNKLATIIAGRNVQGSLMEESHRNSSGFQGQNRQIKVEKNSRENNDEDEEQKGGGYAQRNANKDNNNNNDNDQQNDGLGAQSEQQNVKSEAITRPDGGQQQDNLETHQEQQNEYFIGSQEARIVDSLVINSSHSQSDYGPFENEANLSEQLENNKYKKSQIKAEEENVVDNFNQNQEFQEVPEQVNDQAQEQILDERSEIQRQTENVEESNGQNLSSPNSKSQKSSLKRYRSQSQEREDPDIEPHQKRLKSISTILEEQQHIFKLLAAEKSIFENSKCKSVTSDALLLKEEFVEEQSKDCKDTLKAFVGCLKQSKLPSSFAGFFFLRGPNNLKVDCLFPNGKIEKECEKQALKQAIAEARKIEKISTLHVYMNGSSCEELKESQKVGEFEKIQFHKCSFSRISSC